MIVIAIAVEDIFFVDKKWQNYSQKAVYKTNEKFVSVSFALVLFRTIQVQRGVLFSVLG